MHLVGAIAEFLILNPQVSIDLQASDRTVDLVEERTDIALRISQQLDPNLISRKLGACPSVLCASPNYLGRRGEPSSLADICGGDCSQASRRARVCEASRRYQLSRRAHFAHAERIRCCRQRLNSAGQRAATIAARPNRRLSLATVPLCGLAVFADWLDGSPRHRIRVRPRAVHPRTASDPRGKRGRTP